MRTGTRISAAARLARSLNESGWRAALKVKRFQTAFLAVGGPVGQKPTEIFELDETDVAATLDEGVWLPIPPELSFKETTDLQMGATLLLVTVRAGFNLLEFVDFLLGFGGLDIAGDDGLE